MDDREEPDPKRRSILHILEDRVGGCVNDLGAGLANVLEGLVSSSEDPAPECPHLNNMRAGRVEAKAEQLDQTGSVVLCDAAPGASHVPRLKDVFDWCKCMWDSIVKVEHPLVHLRQSLKSKEAKVHFCRTAIQAMEGAHPAMRSTCMKTIQSDDAQTTHIGCSGEAHLLMAGFDKMQGTAVPVFWKGDPATDRLWAVVERALMSGKGCDTTTKALKLAVAKEFGNRDLSKLVLFAGYAAGSTLGGGSLLLLYMLTQFPASGGDVWSVPEVHTFLTTIARLKVTFVIYESAADRSIDAWCTLCF